jgi:hypothetical protein
MKHEFVTKEIPPAGYNFNAPHAMRVCRRCGVPEPCIEFGKQTDCVPMENLKNETP